MVCQIFIGRDALKERRCVPRRGKCISALLTPNNYNNLTLRLVCFEVGE